MLHSNTSAFWLVPHTQAGIWLLKARVSNHITITRRTEQTWPYLFECTTVHRKYLHRWRYTTQNRVCTFKNRSTLLSSQPLSLAAPMEAKMTLLFPKYLCLCVGLMALTGWVPYLAWLVLCRPQRDTTWRAGSHLQIPAAVLGGHAAAMADVPLSTSDRDPLLVCLLPYPGSFYFLVPCSSLDTAF